MARWRSETRGMDMQTGKRTSERGTMHEVVRALVGIGLFVLVTGVWVCLWVPPSF
jgi:uncharacterized membrane protein